MIYLIIFVTRVKMIPDVVTEWHRQHSCVASLQSSEPSIITVRITCWVSGSCCSELRHHSHTWCNVSDVNVLSTAVDSCLCCSVPTDQITFIQDVGQMSLRRFSSRYHSVIYCQTAQDVFIVTTQLQVEQEWLDWGLDGCFLSPAVWSLLLFFLSFPGTCQ